jgi:perosamine synthetase
MSTDFIPVNEPLLNGNEENYLIECIRTGWISSEGPFIEKFENEFSARVGRKYGVAVCNGSAALELSICCLGIRANDEVIMPTHTIISCASAVVRAGGIPVLVDCDPITFNMRVDHIESRITDRTKAIMIVHIYGFPVDVYPILELAKKYNLKVIEDAAEMHGQFYYDKPCGSFGDISIFSFYPNKHITTGEGGMIVADCCDLVAKARYYRNLCFNAEKRFVHHDLGWNYRMTNLQAAVGIAQLERLSEFIQIKRKNGKLYLDLLADIHELQLPLMNNDYAQNIFWVFPLVIKENIEFESAEMMHRLQKLGVGTRPFFWPIHKQPVFEKLGMFSGESHPVAEMISRRGFYIPSGLALTEHQIIQVVKKIKTALVQ